MVGFVKRFQFFEEEKKREKKEKREKKKKRERRRRRERERRNDRQLTRLSDRSASSSVFVE